MSSDYSFDQISQLVSSLRKNGWTKESVTLLGQCGEQKSASIRLFLEGGAEVISKPAQPKPELVTNSIIRIDRSVKPIYPDWVKELLYPELESVGPAEYDLAKVEQWLHDSQKNSGCVKGQKIYEHLKKNKMLESCFSLTDLLAIQAKGVAFFREHFVGKAVFGWKSVVRSRGGDLGAPYLCEDGGGVMLRWRWLEDGWGSDGPALRFAS